MTLRKLILPALALLAAVAAAPLALADRRGGDHDEALRAVEAQRAMPLAAILQIAQRTAPGEVVEVELEQEDGRLIYEIKVLTRTGRVREIEIDARTGAVLSVEEED
ncbi:MAG: PepSY domain-containing protein [Hyphomonadaceae bacterium]|nr:PepSY domain-containing protein [Hyphomonadaceae bacterium]